VLLGLLTGNVEEGARAKLAPTGLLPHFAFGAYGSDSALRPDLPAVAVARAAALNGRSYTGKQVVVVGDTPSDIDCGAHLGVRTVAVATGRYSVEELIAHGADRVFADFSDWQAAIRAMVD
jgi:phosphoglycolate phosphatase